VTTTADRLVEIVRTAVLSEGWDVPESWLVSDGFCLVATSPGGAEAYIEITDRKD